ncbi:hypothetical protein MLD38_014297 [Melastoma candidum]|uniref:Uncharacterized protein n=1 Tax=Melastoma candidum TaxID=119954 RepID=A0ACB9RG24_9MYRT|nr:hypothetical protein MLD38_014297 [Melastoma candidum]
MEFLRIWLLSAPRVAKSQTRLTCIPLVRYWSSLSPGRRRWTSTAQRVNGASPNGYDLEERVCSVQVLRMLEGDPVAS